MKKVNVLRVDGPYAMDLVTRVEIIDHSPNGLGRAWVKHNLSEVELSVQDNGRTLKVFVK